MDHIEALAEKLRAAGYNIGRLSEAECSEVFRLARAARIELPRPGVAWPSSEIAHWATCLSLLDAIPWP